MSDYYNRPEWSYSQMKLTIDSGIDYAIANNCTWSYQGTMYGDDRDYVCK